jgi:hypothetical protein
MREYKEVCRINITRPTKGVLIFSCLAFLLVVSCKREESPADVLSREQMVKVLSELYLTEEKVNKLSLNRDSAALVFNYFNDEVFKKVGTTDSVFRRSMDYYMERPKEIEKIYAALIDSLNLQEQRLSIPK